MPLPLHFLLITNNLMLYLLHSHSVSSESKSNAFVNVWSLSFASGLVITSAIISSVGQYFKHIFWFSSFSLMKWCCICLVRELCGGFFPSAMHPWLSHMMDVGSSCTYLTPTKSCLSQTASFMQWMVTILFRLCHRQYNGWLFLHFHEMTRMPIINMYPVLDCQSFASSIQFASQNPLKVITFPLRYSLESKVFFKYLIMRFMAIQCRGLAFDKNWLTRLTANVTSTFVATIAYIRDPTPALYGTSCGNTPRH